MDNKPLISVIIPVLNEETSIGLVLKAIPPSLVNEVIVADNGSSDNTVELAKKNGARVVLENTRGYGSACLKAIEALSNPDILVILDGDYSDYPEDMTLIVAPIIENKADMVLGSRTMGNPEKGSLTLQQRLGNNLASWLINLLHHKRFSDFGPFRAIRFTDFTKLNMTDKNFGWNVEMQIKAIRNGLRIKEVPVRYRKRTGKSKISGTIMGTIKTGTKIIYSIFKYTLKKEEDK